MGKNTEITLSAATMEALASVVALAVVGALQGTAATTVTGTVTQQPAPKGRARRSRKTTGSKTRQVATFGVAKSYTETTAGGLRKGQVFSLYEGGAQYRSTSPKGSAVVKGFHPKGETYDFASAKTVLLVTL